MSLVTRRSLVKTLALGGMLPALLPASGVSAQQERGAGEAAAVPSAFQAQTEPKPLPFEAGSLDGLSEDLIQSHWENNYGGSVRALNTVQERLAGMLDDDDVPAFVYNDLKREHLMRTGSVVLHELYFGNMAPPGQRNGELDRALSAAFGDIDRWEKEFKRIGAGLGGGSGWVILAWNRHLDTLENYWMADHMHAPATAAPLLVMDMYEHSYQMDYGAAASEYIDAFMRNIDWEEVAGRLDAARAA